MRLIYVWIEKYRNIEQCGFQLVSGFSINIKHEGKSEEDIPIKSINIKKNRDCLNIYGENISSVTAIVGRNSVGKSNFISCIGDLITSLENSSFIFLYYDETTNDYIVECNHIAIKDKKGKIEYSKYEKYGHKALVLKLKNGEIEKTIDDEILYDIEYATIKDNLNDMMFPNANYCIGTSIPRCGLGYKDLGVLYPFAYLMDYTKNTENYKNNDITISFKIIEEDFDKDEYDVRILPKHFLNEKNYWEEDCNSERESYKKVFMLRFFERALNFFRFPKDKLIRKDKEELKEIINLCQGDISELLKNYNAIKEIVIKIRTTLMEKGKENDIDMELCYAKFVNLMEKIILKIEPDSFMNSYNFIIKISLILKDKDLKKDMYDLLKLADSHDICLEFTDIKIKIKYENISEGLKERFNVFSTIYKCLNQNEIQKFKNIVLILDEPDVHMHPEWSRRLFSEILEFLKKEFANSKFQIIFTTHSPFMISNIFKEDVIYLDKTSEGKLNIKDNDINTFGANIHILLKHSFFMDSTMGEFARSKINEVINFISNPDYIGDMNKEKAKYICENIGEDLIRNKMLNLYNNRFPAEIGNKDEKIHYLEKEILQLQEIIKKEQVSDKNEFIKFRESLDKVLKNMQILIGDNTEKDD